MSLYRSPLTVTLWPSSFLKKYGPMIPPTHKAHQTNDPLIDSNCDIRYEVVYVPYRKASWTVCRLSDPPVSTSKAELHSKKVFLKVWTRKYRE
ncbi:hypothetical protein TNCV_1274691 [Trichonephila clavipes]|nr:hypothetical protein TNCV_1274691 [Trichonephila clavipes]